MKKAKILILSFFIMLGTLMITQNANAEEAPIEIRTPNDLMAINNDPSASYILMNDIDLSETKKGGELDAGNGWVPLSKFKGVLDGNGYRIIGMHMDCKGNSIYGYGETYGLFSEIEKGGVVKNLGLIDIDINMTGEYQGSGFYCGSITGYCAGTIQNCFVTGNMIEEAEFDMSLDREYVGGVCGYVYGTVIDLFCKVNIECNGRIERICGIAGEICNGEGAHYATVENCYYIGQIKYKICNQYHIVDPVGYRRYANGKPKNVFYLKDCIEFYSEEDIEPDYNTNSSEPKTDTQMKMQGSFTGYDFDNIWEIDPYCSYKYPQLKNNRIVRVESMEVTGLGKNEYFQGDKMDLTGVAVKITYEDGISTSIPLTMEMMSGIEMDRIGKQTATITYGGKTQSFEIEVKAVPVKSISMPAELSIYRPDSQQITAKVLPENASNKTLKWTSSDTSIATVSNSGLVKAKNPGSVTITATSEDGVTATCDVTVLVACTSLSVNTNSITLEVGDSKEIKTEVLPIECTDEIKWKSSNERIVQVENGKITAVSAGDATVTAYTDNGKEAQCEVIVNIPVEKIALPEAVNIYSGKSETMKAVFTPENAANKKLKWESEDSDIASVDASGQVSAKNAGTTTITATTSNGKTATCKVTVLVPCTSIRLDQSDIRLEVGKTGEIKADILPVECMDVVKWKTDNSQIVKVENGKITAVAAGNTVITAYTDSGMQAQCRVSAVIPVNSVSIPATVKLYTAKSQKLTVSFAPENATDKTITWNSSNANIASVDDTGLVRAKATGTTTITATSSNGKTAECKVTVLVACVSIILDKDTYEMQTGEVGKITAIPVPANASDIIKWKTSNAGIADVANGEIYAIAGGQAIITAYTDQGINAVCTVTVIDVAQTVKQVKNIKLKIKSAKNVKGKKLKVTINKNSILDGYEIQYATKSNFGNKKTVKCSEGSCTVKKLKKNKKYYVRYRGYKSIRGTVYYSNWSAVKKVVIKK